MARLGGRAAAHLVVLLGVSLAALVWTGAAAASCADCVCTGDRDGDGTVTIDEVVAAVHNALDGCPQLHWYPLCGPAVPGNQICPPTTVFCTEEVGAGCDDPEARCCVPGSRCGGLGSCNSRLVCAEHDPRPPGGCRLRSRRQEKHDIEYLAQPDLEQLRGKLLAMNLTRFRYNDDAPSAAPHLGFIIEDVEPSPSVDSQHDAVDLYGYVSMAVATIQVQAGEIKALRQELDALQRRLGRLDDGSAVREQ